MPNIRPLPPNLQEIAKKQLNEDPKRIDSDLAHLRDWLSKQPHLKARTDDQFLTAFLRGCKFSLERTKEKLDFYYTSRTALKEFFTDRDPMKPEIQKFLDLGVMLPLPEPDELGRRILIFRSGRYDPNEFNTSDICKVNFMLMDYMLMNDDCYNTAGVVSIGDMKDATMAHAAQMSPTLIKQTMKCSQDGYPFRIKKLLYINVPQFFETVFNLFKSFAKDKLQKRMCVYAGMNSLYQDIPQKLLPNEYGGEAGSFEELSKDFKKQMESFRDWFIEDEKYGADESKRPGKPKSYEDLFGVEGSFRKLTVD
ncbi:retinol-binding protein pinta-like isoform X1 [Ischnura elegans]|uniref:retinol-binding protein pinta-like isoform X1 n=1 Tax=Ischnura elegans TaxID=197161 RepID=UPI001ED86C39|nr:retinol-binding protein pinta-like isoform X1 [Ischnura elegans]XP_046386009.1 retinol-binding protein pinta-like isoform X1 [Ischnura elegans]